MIVLVSLFLYEMRETRWGTWRKALEGAPLLLKNFIIMRFRALRWPVIIIWHGGVLESTIHHRGLVRELFLASQIFIGISYETICVLGACSPGIFDHVSISSSSVWRVMYNCRPFLVKSSLVGTRATQLRGWSILRRLYPTRFGLHPPHLWVMSQPATIVQDVAITTMPISPVGWAHQVFCSIHPILDWIFPVHLSLFLYKIKII